MRNCIAVKVAGQYPVTLKQAGRDNFTVTYGKQVDRNLVYGEAAHVFGSCVMHALACAGKLDNRDKGEQ